LAWTIELSKKADKSLDRIGKADQRRIISALEQIALLDDPRQRGHSLVGHYTGYWRYRVGDYRIIAKIEDGRLVVVVIDIGHRRTVYR
jgi:mRNA interferase RelE/StbE